MITAKSSWVIDIENITRSFRLFGVTHVSLERTYLIPEN